MSWTFSWASSRQLRKGTSWEVQKPGPLRASTAEGAVLEMREVHVEPLRQDLEVRVPPHVGAARVLDAPGHTSVDHLLGDLGREAVERIRRLKPRDELGVLRRDVWQPEREGLRAQRRRSMTIMLKLDVPGSGRSAARRR